MLPSLPSTNALQILFGLALGLLLGICYNFEAENEEDAIQHRIAPDRPRFAGPVTEMARNDDNDVWLQCLVMIRPAAQNPHKYLASIRDTYARHCNETLFFTNSKKLRDNFAESARVLLIESPAFDTSIWHWVHTALLYAREKGERSNAANNAAPMLIAIMNEQNYLVRRNLLQLVRPYASHFPSFLPIILGRIVQTRWLFSYIFPFLRLNTFKMEGGIVLSESALDVVLSDKCSPESWFTPRYAGKALLRCARQSGISEWDPIDEDTHQPLFVTTDIRILFASGSSSTRRPATGHSVHTGNESAKDGMVTSECCSHRVVSFGSLSYQDQRLVHYFADSAFSVYGL